MQAKLVTVSVIVVSLLAGMAASRALDIRIEERNESVVDVPDAAAVRSGPLALRLVDAGGVGIEADTAAWGGSYSHGTGAFHSLVAPGSAVIDAKVWTRVERDWSSYIDRMSDYGANGVVVPAFLEFIDFDNVGGGAEVYEPGSVFRQRHAALRAAFGELFDTAAARGIGIYLKTDMLALTDPLERELRERSGWLNTDDPRLWDVYAAGLDELFTAMPAVTGVVVRIGEAGSLYNLDGWEYRSAMGVRTPAQLRLMLRTLLPVFEKHGRDLVLRSWSVGVGPLGELHTDPDVYASVLGDIDSPNFVVSTKYTRGDYFSYLPLNPTLTGGLQRRLIEFQARREFEAFTAFPNFLAEDHARAIRAVTAANDNVVGTSMWTQEGGPLHAGPMSLYPVHGFWAWIDANVYATSRLALDPGADPRDLAADWVRERISDDPVVVDGLTRVLMRSRDAVRRGLYVRPFAERSARVAGVESTPMMWIMEWDVVGDWSAISSTVYRAAGGDVSAAVDDGFAAVEDVRYMRHVLDELAPRMAGLPVYGGMRRSLAYEQSLLETLAWYRGSLFAYYEWLDTGAGAARARWSESATSFEAAAIAHENEFGGDLDFPAFDFGPALAGLDRAERSAQAAEVARALLAALVLVIALALLAVAPGGMRPVSHGWTARLRGFAGSVATRVRAVSRPHGQRAGWILGAVTLLVCGTTTAALFAFDAPRLAAGFLMLIVAFAVALEGAWWRKAPQPRGGRSAAALVPLLAGSAVAAAALAVRGSDHFWFLFWSDSLFRGTAVAVAAAVMLSTATMAHRTGKRVGMDAPGALGATLIAMGVTLIATSALLPDLNALLASLDRPLAQLPVRFALVAALTEYAGVPANSPWYPAMAGSVMLAGGGLLRALGRPGPVGSAAS